MATTISQGSSESDVDIKSDIRVIPFQHGAVMLTNKWVLEKVAYLDQSVLEKCASKLGYDEYAKSSVLRLLKLPIALVRVFLPPPYI
jgi:hypothetical protein